MKLVNKNTTNIKVFGEIVPCNEHDCIAVKTDRGVTWYYRSLAELNAEWEDYEEPKEYWYIDYDGGILCGEKDDSSAERMMISMGNYFELLEEAEKAVEKLKAWKVLKDMGFKIAGIRYRNNKNYIEWNVPQKVRDDYYAVSAFNEALHLLFGGEE